MSQTSFTNAGLRASGRLDRTIASGLAMQTAFAAFVLAAVLLFYQSVYPLHHDLAGSLLSGRLAVALGSAYSDYSIYFPPAERIWFSLAAHLSDALGLRPDLVVVAMTVNLVVDLAYKLIDPRIRFS